jgi:hypothetical protein
MQRGAEWFGTPSRHNAGRILKRLQTDESRALAVRPEGADYQWRKIQRGELSIDPVADDRLVRVTARAGASHQPE